MSLEILKSATKEVMPDRQLLSVVMQYNTRVMPDAIQAFNNAIGTVRQAVSHVQNLTYKLGNARVVEVHNKTAVPFMCNTAYICIPFTLEAPADQNLLDYVLQALDGLSKKHMEYFNYRVSFNYQVSPDLREETRKSLIAPAVQKCFEEAKLYMEALAQQEVSVQIPVIPKSLVIRDIYPVNDTCETVRYKTANHTAEDYHIDRELTPVPVTTSVRVIFGLEGVNE